MSYLLIFLLFEYSIESWIEVFNSTTDPIFGNVDYPSFGVSDNNIFIYGGISDNSSVDMSKGIVLKSFNTSILKYTAVNIELENKIHNKSSFVNIERDGQLISYHFGGYEDDLLTNQMQVVNCSTVDPNCTVQTLKPNENTPTGRYGSVLLYYKNKLYLFGGKNKNSDCDDDIYEYDIKSDKWNKIEILNNGAKPSCRYYLAGSVYIDKNDNTKDYLIIYGGINIENDKDYYSDVWRYSFIEKNWKEIKIIGPKLKRAFHSINLIDKKLIVHGGYKIGDKVNTISGDTLILELNDNNNNNDLEWKLVDKINLPRYKHSSIILDNNYILITGGKNEDNENVEGLYMLNYDSSISLSIIIIYLYIYIETPPYENIPDINPLMYIALIFPIIISVIIPLILCLASYREGMIITNFQQTMEGMGIRPGVPQSILDNLTVRNFHKDKDSEYDTCPICLVEFGENEQVKELPCQHLFHPPCVDTWLNVSQLCPMCKSSVLTNQQQDERREHLQNNIAVEQQRIFEILDNADIDPNEVGVNRIIERNNYIPQANTHPIINNNTTDQSRSTSTPVMMSTTSVININNSGNRRSQNDFSRYNESYPTPLMESLNNNNNNSSSNSNTRREFQRHLTPSSPHLPPDTLRSHSRYSGSSNGNENENKEEKILNGPPKDMEDI